MCGWRAEGGFERVSRGDLLKLYREALPFLAASGGAAALTYSDQLVAATVLPAAEAGLYAVAQRAGLLMVPLSSAAGAVTFSEAAREPAGARAPRPWGRALGVVMGTSSLAVGVGVWFLCPYSTAGLSSARGSPPSWPSREGCSALWRTCVSSAWRGWACRSGWCRGAWRERSR